ncbi:hypothetical protein [Rhizobium mongolense]|uniref:hypothetical protein n=1 Tax=Rhizobium mongolense TaxID=57676 RepID=UPI0034A1120A
MEALLNDGRSRRLGGATLTTDRFAPFNAPFRASLGFQLIERDKCSPRLRSILHSGEEKGAEGVGVPAIETLAEMMQRDEYGYFIGAKKVLARSPSRSLQSE